MNGFGEFLINDMQACSQEPLWNNKGFYAQQMGSIQITKGFRIISITVEMVRVYHTRGNFAEHSFICSDYFKIVVAILSK